MVFMFLNSTSYFNYYFMLSLLKWYINLHSIRGIGSACMNSGGILLKEDSPMHALLQTHALLVLYKYL